ncbi:MAG: ABC transporter permease [Actinomycetota bacterium]|nr:ABC transporter permease [Actinomycetota bacterium]
MNKRWVSYIIAFFIIISLNFAIPRLLPGDPVSAIYGEDVMVKLSEDVKEYINSAYNIDKPVISQYFLYLASLFKGNLGYSLYYKQSVGKLLMSYMPFTLLLMGLAVIISSFFAFILGIESGWRRGKKIDLFLLYSIIISSGFPSFFIAALFLIFFGITLGALPMQGARTAYSGFTGFGITSDFLKHLVLPLSSLIFILIPPGYFLTRNAMLSNIKEPYILLARAKGLSDSKIRYGHAGRNSLIPFVTQTGMRMGTIIVTGSLFIEMVFSYPGMGSLIYNSILNRDYPVLQGSLLIVTFLVLIINFFMDILYVKIDPRIKYAH